MAPRLADKMFHRTRDAPMSRRSTIDLLFIMQRHAVFSINQDSADHISDIIFAQQAIEDSGDASGDAQKYELLNDFHSGYDINHKQKARPAPKLREAMDKARQKWAAILRDEDLVDVRVIVLPSEERDFEHIHPPVDLNEHPYGNQLQRFSGLKKKLVEEGGGMPYRLTPRSRSRVTMELDLVITREALERIATPYMQMVLGFKIHTITAPAPPSDAEPHRPDAKSLWGNGGLTVDEFAHILRTRSARSLSIEKSVRAAPKQPWNYPFPAGPVGNGKSRQPQWSGEDGPFAKDIYDLGSNNDWIEKDLELRTAQISQWAAAKQDREKEFQTTLPDPHFSRLEGLAQCETYTADRSSDWYESNLVDNVTGDYTAALRATNAETVKYHQAREMWKMLGAQHPRQPDVVEFYRQAMENQMNVLERAKQHCATISQGLPPPAPRPKMKWDRPAQETRQLAEPGRTPIPVATGGARGYGPTLRPSARPAPKRQDLQKVVPARGNITAGRVPDRVVGQEDGQLKFTKRLGNLVGHGRAALFPDRPKDLPLGRVMPQVPLTQPQQKLTIGPGGIPPKISNHVPLEIPGDTLPSLTKKPEPNDENHQTKVSTTSDTENSPISPKPATPSANRSVQRRTTDQDSTSLRRVPSLVYNNDIPLKSVQAPPAVSPTTPKDYKVRSVRLRHDQIDALQTLELTVKKDNLINLGSPQGMLPNLRRLVSGLTQGVA